MKQNCPELECKSENGIIKDGFYFRKDDSKKIQRYKCKSCGKRFSKSTSSLFYRAKRRRDTNLIKHLVCSSTSIRRISRILKMNRSSVTKRVDKLEKVALLQHQKLLKSLAKEPITHLQFDDLITHEHTKMKPLSVSLAVCQNTRIILGAEVSRIPAFGHLAKKSRKKYGYRKNEHEKGLTRLFESLHKCIDQNAVIKSDKHKTYPKYVSKYFQNAEHLTYEGGRSCIAGLGELKRKGYDPLFILNHTCAMLRDSLKVLSRKTWCSVKRVDRLQQQLNIFISYYNFDYLHYKLNTT